MARCRVISFVVAFSVATLACGSSKPPTSPDVGEENPAEIAITGSERLGWGQSASNLGEASSYTYRLYVDNSPVELSKVACEASTAEQAYNCSAALPRLAAGRHTLSLTAVDSAGTEGPRSSTLLVRVAGS